VLKGQMRFSGASIAHAGFGLLMIGVLVSSVNKTIISYSKAGIGMYSEKTEDGKVDSLGIAGNRENALLIKGRKTRIGDYRAIYRGHYEKAPDKFFVVGFEKIDRKTGKITDTFTLEPNSQNNPKMGLVSNPDTRHYFSRDVFTHISFESGMDTREEEEFKDFQTDTVLMGGSFNSPSGMVFVKFLGVDKPNFDSSRNLIEIKANVLAYNLNDTQQLSPVLQIEGNSPSYQPAVSDRLGFIVALTKVLPDNEDPSNTKFVLTTSNKRPKVDYIILKAIEFPFIVLVWGGTVIMLIGFMVALVARVRTDV
jgi:cytochrome c-type biogenesis protein CcmF